MRINLSILTFTYLLSAACFITGIRYLGSPATARRGNQIAAAGMILALAMSVLNLSNVLPWGIVVPGVLVGGIVGATAARTVRMTAMPQMVAIFNGMGAGTAAIVGIIHILTTPTGVQMGWVDFVSTLLATSIGSLSVTGSLIAFLKLQELLSGRPITYPLQKVVNAILLIAIVVCAVLTFGHGGPNHDPFLILVGAALVLGILFVLPIGGADMPVVISLLNSMTGIATALTGFVLSNTLLIVAGTLVGASGMILTQLMGKAMNRSIASILFGAFGSIAGGAGETSVTDTTVRQTTVDDLAVILAYSSSVIIIPGYGLAVARAQHEIKELSDLLEQRHVNVRYAIHPVAGRMPGHMNVLLAEANVPYTELFEMDAINGDFPQADVAIVIGANDVVNPAALNTPSSPIYGMPILRADLAKSVVVLKRSMSPGFAGIDNELFYRSNTMMLFGDAKASLTALVAAVKEVG